MKKRNKKYLLNARDKHQETTQATLEWTIGLGMQRMKNYLIGFTAKKTT